MSLQFIMGNSGAGKSRYAYQKILAEAMRHPEKTYLIIVPEQFTMQTQKELVSLHPAGGILNVDILSFQRLAYRIFEETGGSLYPVLEETGKSLVVKRVAQEKKKELTILGSTLKRTGAVSQMKSLISELKQYQIAPSELDTWAEETGEKKLLAAKLKDTGVIYRAFEEYLENRYVTAEDVLEVLAGKLEESSLIRNSEVLVDGFTGFTPVQIGVLGKLFRLCEKVYVTIIMDEREDPYKKAIPHQLFAMSRQLIQQLMKAADEAGCPVEPEIWVRRSGYGRFQSGSMMDQLEQNLFRYGIRRIVGTEAGKRAESKAGAGTNGKNKKEIGPSTLENAQKTKKEHLESGQNLKQQGIYISVAPSPRAELEETVRLIRRMVREEKMRYQDFAVLTGDLSIYGTYAREIFEKFGEAYYRALETVALKQLIQDSERKVISLGAGVPLQEQNEKYLKELGTVVYLKGSLTTLKKRLADSKKDPMLDGEDRDDKIKKLLKQRDPVYQKFADIQVVTGEVPFEELIKEIEEKLSTYEKNS